MRSSGEEHWKESQGLVEMGVEAGRKGERGGGGWVKAVRWFKMLGCDMIIIINGAEHPPPPELRGSQTVRGAKPEKILLLRDADRPAAAGTAHHR